MANNKTTVTTTDNKEVGTVVDGGALTTATTGDPGSVTLATPTPTPGTSIINVPHVQIPAGLEAQQVTIPAETLKRLMDQLDVQDETLKQVNQQIDLLRKSANQGKLVQAENDARPAELPKAFLKVFMGKVVVGWKTVKSETFFNPSNPDFVIGEVLKSNYTFLDGTESGPIDQVLFTRCEDRVVVSLLNSKEELKNSMLKELKVKFEYLITSDELLKESFVMPTEEAVVNPNFINP